MRTVTFKLFGSMALAFVLGAVPIVTGCDKTKSEQDTEVKHPDGTTEVDKTKTVQKPDGSVEQKTEKSTSGPSTP